MYTVLKPTGDSDEKASIPIFRASNNFDVVAINSFAPAIID